MDVVEIIKAYEVFKTYGLDVSSIFRKGSVPSSKEVDRVAYAPDGNPKQKEVNILVGNTGHQLQFLRQTIDEDYRLQFLRQTNNEGNIAKFSKEVEQAEEKIEDGVARVESAGKNKDYEHENSAAADADNVVIPDEKQLEDYTVGELMLLKEDIEQIYGEGFFASHIGKEIVNLLGLEEKVSGGRSKTFVDVLKNGESNEEKFVNQKSVPLKPISTPTVVGGNITVELDIEE